MIVFYCGKTTIDCYGTTVPSTVTYILDNGEGFQPKLYYVQYACRIYTIGRRVETTRSVYISTKNIHDYIVRPYEL